MICVFDELAKFLKTLDGDLPLKIDALEPCSPSLRYSDIHPPTPHPNFLGATHFLSSELLSSGKISGAVMYDPIETVLRFESSNKWPEDLNAIHAAKAAFLGKLAALIEGVAAKKTNSSLGSSAKVNVYADRLDMGFGGFVFRIKVRCDAELKLLTDLPNPMALELECIRRLKSSCIRL